MNTHGNHHSPHKINDINMSVLSARGSFEGIIYSRLSFTCPDIIIRPSSVKAHMVTHTGEKRKELLIRIIILHPNDNIKFRILGYPCTVQGCDKRFTTKSNLKRHSTVHGSDAENAENDAGPLSQE